MGERVKIFRFYCHKSCGKIEAKINCWLGENENKIEIVRVNCCGCGTSDMEMLMIFYKLVETKTKTEAPQPIVLPKEIPHVHRSLERPIS